MTTTDKFTGALLGLAVGDAVGTTLEFKPRGTFTPIDDMNGGGPFGLNAGEWTDDMSMALCLGYSLLEKEGFDAADQMERYTKWMHEGYMSSNGVCFDIGNTVRAALLKFNASGNPFSGSTEPMSAGNGSLMRLAPVPLFYYPDLETAVHHAAESSRTTHGAEECLDACRYFTGLLFAIFNGEPKDVVLKRPLVSPTTPKIQAIANGDYLSKPMSAIKGSGYVVDALEASLYCFAKTDTYRDAILMAANLGDDADTTAAICGQLAGAFYGKSGIPAEWLEKCVMVEEIEQLALGLST